MCRLLKWNLSSENLVATRSNPIKHISHMRNSWNCVSPPNLVWMNFKLGFNRIGGSLLCAGLWSFAAYLNVICFDFRGAKHNQWQSINTMLVLSFELSGFLLSKVNWWDGIQRKLAIHCVWRPFYSLQKIHRLQKNGCLTFISFCSVWTESEWYGFSGEKYFMKIPLIIFSDLLNFSLEFLFFIFVLPMMTISSRLETNNATKTE